MPCGAPFDVRVLAVVSVVSLNSTNRQGLESSSGAKKDSNSRFPWIVEGFQLGCPQHASRSSSFGHDSVQWMR